VNIKSPLKLSLGLLITIALTVLPHSAPATEYLRPPGAHIESSTATLWQTEHKKKANRGLLPEQQHTTLKPETQYLNALILENSPYLLQHASNPVNWRNWTDESLKAAIAQDKLILLSIGYSTCHWCHVMNSESFNNPAIAELVNTHFVAIKVDREELPAIDLYYSDILAKVTGSAGWPLTAILDTSTQPIFIGSYLKPNKLQALLTRVAELQKLQPDQLTNMAKMLAISAPNNSHLENFNSPPLTDNELNIVVDKVLDRLDTKYGGIKGQQKFPNEPVLKFLLACLPRYPQKPLQQAIAIQLNNMVSGGLYDPVNGGFFRYATDRYWRLPHYEKMLYSQGALLGIYSEAFIQSQNTLYKWVASDLSNFLDAWMHQPNLGFSSAVNADSRGIEGFYYLWDNQSISTLSPENIINAGLTTYAVAQPKGQQAIVISQPNSTAAEKIRTTLSQIQKKRRPFIDKKVITSWNAMVISGLAAAHELIGKKAKPDNLARLEQQAHQLWSTMYAVDEAKLYRTFYAAQRTIAASLEDYAHLLLALIDLYDLTSNTIWLERAKTLSNHLLTNFLNKNSTFRFSNSQTQEGLDRQQGIMRDGELPATDAVALEGLWRLWARTGDRELKNALKAPTDRIRNKFRFEPLRQLYAGQVLAKIDLGSVANAQYFANGHGKLHVKRATTSADNGASCPLFTIAVQLDPGWHVNSHAPIQDYLRPTRVTTNTHTDMHTNVHYPEAKTISLDFQQEPLSVYEGDFAISITSENCTGTDRDLVLDIELQACTDKICLAPQSLNVTLPKLR
jgi:uncharacterized protein YyaL (SSP411 family)